MFNRRELIKSGAVLAAVSALPSPASATIFSVFEIVPRKTREFEAYTWANVADWSSLQSVSPLAACATCHTLPFYSNSGLRLATSAMVRVCAMASGGGKVRIVSYYYNSNGAVVWDKTWGETTPGINPTNQGIVITTKWNALWGDPVLRAYEHSFMIEVIGTGKLYEAQLELDYI